MNDRENALYQEKLINKNKKSEHFTFSYKSVFWNLKFEPKKSIFIICLFAQKYNINVRFIELIEGSNKEISLPQNCNFF